LPTKLTTPLDIFKRTVDDNIKGHLTRLSLRKCKLESAGSVQGLVAAYDEHGNEVLGYTKMGNYLPEWVFVFKEGPIPKS